jgi:heme oxygenase
LLGAGVVDGRRFFTGHGAATGDVWRDYLTQLAAVPDVALKQAVVVEGAIETFAIFEHWLEGWDEIHE